MNFTGIILAGGKSSRFKFNKLKIKVNHIPLFVDQIFKLSFFCREILISTSKNNSSIILSHLTKINEYFNHFKKIFESSFIKRKNFNSIFTDDLKIPEINIVEDNYSKIDRSIINDLGIDASCSIYSNKWTDNPNSYASSPMLGIYSGLKNASYFYSLVLAFDMPFISYRFLEMLVEFIKKNEGDLENSFVKQNFEANKAGNLKDAYIIKTNKGFEVLSSLYSKNCTKILEENIKKGDYKISNIFPASNIEIIDESILKLKNIDSFNFFNINRIEDLQQFSKIWRNEDLITKKSEGEVKLLKPFRKAVSHSDNTFLGKWAGFYFR